MEAGTLIVYFAERNEARRSLRELQRRGFPRAAWVHKTANGEVHIRDPFLWRRALGVSLTAIVFAGLAGVASLILHGPAPILSGSLPRPGSDLRGWIDRNPLGWGVDTTIEVRCRTKAA